MKMTMMYKLHHLLIQNKYKILITALFVLGFYHLFMFGLKWNVFNISEDQIIEIKPILYRFYHLSYNLVICLGFLFRWNKKAFWVLLYFGFKIVYNLLLFIGPVKDVLHNSLYDGFSFGILIIVILELIRREKNS